MVTFKTFEEIWKFSTYHALGKTATFSQEGVAPPLGGPWHHITLGSRKNKQNQVGDQGFAAGYGTEPCGPSLHFSEGGWTLAPRHTLVCLLS